MKKAIVLGGTHDHIKLIEILKHRGYYTILIDYLENPPAKAIADEHIQESILDLEKTRALAQQIKPELVLTACIDQALLTMAYVCEELNLPCHVDYQTALALTNKVYMKKKMVVANIPTSRFVVLDNGKTSVPSGFKFPLVVKPADSNSSKGITRINTLDEIDRALNIALANSRTLQVIAEEFIDGEEFSVDIAVRDFEPVIVLITKNIKASWDENTFTIVQSFYPATNEPKIIGQINEIAKRIIKAYAIKNSPLLIQIIHHAGRLYVVEFSARLGGGSKHYFIKKITNVDLLEWFVNGLLKDPTSVSVEQKYQFGCVNYIYAHKGGIGSFVNFDELVQEKIIDQYFFYKTPGMEVTNHISSSDRPAGYLIVDDDINSLNNRMLFASQRLRILNIDEDDIILRDEIL